MPLAGGDKESQEGPMAQATGQGSRDTVVRMGRLNRSPQRARANVICAWALLRGLREWNPNHVRRHRRRWRD